MSDQTHAIIADFVNLFKELVDPDEGLTLARITPILGDQFNISTLGVISRFLTNFFYESVELGGDSYVVLKGVRLPLSVFTHMKILESTFSDEDLLSLANALASAGTDVSFPESFVDLHKFYGNGSQRALRIFSDHVRAITEKARDELKPVFQQGVEPRLVTSLDFGGEHDCAQTT